MAHPETLVFEDLGKTSLRCFYRLVAKRKPKAGEWYMSGAEPMAYKARNDLLSEYCIVAPTHQAKPASGWVKGLPVSI